RIYTASLGSGVVMTGPVEVPKAAPSGDVTLRWRLETGDEVRSSPTLSGRSLYIGSYDNSLYAVDAVKGTQLWKFATEGGICGTPLFHDNLVIFGSEDHTVYALDVKEKRVRWRYATG